MSTDSASVSVATSAARGARAGKCAPNPVRFLHPQTRYLTYWPPSPPSARPSWLGRTWWIEERAKSRLSRPRFVPAACQLSRDSSQTGHSCCSGGLSAAACAQRLPERWLIEPARVAARWRVCRRDGVVAGCVTAARYCRRRWWRRLSVSGLQAGRLPTSSLRPF